MPIEPLWYRNAVIYQMHVRSFSDSNGDGIGDFNGVISQLEYLEELGVTAIWLLPFYPSPLKDDGYDIADYTSVNPSYGKIADVRRFIDEAHRRQIRVITELVINHTSDQHAWFQRARRAPKGSPERDFYVWSDDPEKYSGVRIIFKDFEPSNWTFDRVAGQYYWHRFFYHQPDLNFDNPAVHEAVFKVCDFWMGMGVDGVRLDAVPYLYEREGTSCENLPETHAFLKKFRKHVDDHWPGRMLLAEANQWPEDAIAYFGDGDECQMNFHFPLMPRLFMSLRMEDRYPIIDILEQTPPLPPNAQWAMFLRNHDELTLEMVTDEERDYMWRVYASDPAARINLGIRRRLAPLLDNSRRKIELMNALLFSMPGSPIIYYGDEIGMGDNIFLGDRNGVRTPMQWSADRNAGFSRANPQRLFLPIIIDPEYHYEAINVEAQSANPSSLLWWMRRLIALRKRHPVFGRGDVHFLTPTNGKVLVFLRRDESEHILVIANLSRFSQPIELDLSEYVGWKPIELFGNVRFPAVEAGGKYSLSVGPHGFYWFHMEPAKAASDATAGISDIAVRGVGESLLDAFDFDRILEYHLPDLLPTRRWFASKARSIRNCRIVDRILLEAGALFLVQVEYVEGESEMYAMPLVAQLDESTDDPTALLRFIDEQSRRWIVRDGMRSAELARQLLGIALRGGEMGGERLRLAGRPIATDSISADAETLPVKIPEREQSNSNVVFADQLIFKLYRRIDDGINPELEIGEHLAKVGFSNTAPLAGAIELVGRGAPRTLSVALGFVPHQNDAWALFLDHGQRYFEGIDSLTPEQAASALCTPGDPGCHGTDEGPPKEISSLMTAPLELARLLGRRTAEMHAAMADDRGDSAFTAEPFSLTYQRSLLQSMRNTTRSTMQTLSNRIETLTGETRAMADELLRRQADVLRKFHEVTGRPVHASRSRVHGDYHLGQVLWTGKDFVIVDFEGEPLRPVGERRLKRSSLRDVAGMVRSFDYTAWTALKRHRELLPRERSTASQQREIRAAISGSAWLGREFVRAYTIRLRELRSDLIPQNSEDAELVLRSWILEKALYEVRYELNARPDWAEIPLRAVLEILGVSMDSSSTPAASAPTVPAPGAEDHSTDANPSVNAQPRKEPG
ncbi:MAG: maltose alpha-D-glucosyltransferase [Phycisphaerae bacterium]|nr:maltose alpha-D-glucosyltransferase [Phycisphaerae bacterium]